MRADLLCTSTPKLGPAWTPPCQRRSPSSGLGYCGSFVARVEGGGERRESGGKSTFHILASCQDRCGGRKPVRRAMLKCSRWRAGADACRRGRLYIPGLTAPRGVRGSQVESDITMLAEWTSCHHWTTAAGNSMHAHASLDSVLLDSMMRLCTYHLCHYAAMHPCTHAGSTPVHYHHPLSKTTKEMSLHY